MTGALPAADQAKNFCDAVDRRRAQRKLRASRASAPSVAAAVVPTALPESAFQTPFTTPAHAGPDTISISIEATEQEESVEVASLSDPLGGVRLSSSLRSFSLRSSTLSLDRAAPPGSSPASLNAVRPSALAGSGTHAATPKRRSLNDLTTEGIESSSDVHCDARAQGSSTSLSLQAAGTSVGSDVSAVQSSASGGSQLAAHALNAASVDEGNPATRVSPTLALVQHGAIAAIDESMHYIPLPPLPPTRCRVTLRGVTATLTDTHCTQLAAFVEPDEDSPPMEGIEVEVGARRLFC
jgi:hypothetical protein